MSLTDALYKAYGGKIEEVQLITSSGGVFEVYVNEEKVHSKKETKKFPNEEQLIEKLRGYGPS